jgi:hypothetical protein
MAVSNRKKCPLFLNLNLFLGKRNSCSIKNLLLFTTLKLFDDFFCELFCLPNEMESC